ncbi:hypothetical protein HYU19_04840 [Candidatus Woesearchaeota archaeon]|nr:hypothetical protein [Candidatus Woesearchaeota archaeon]
MRLSTKELAVITPGIYRFSHIPVGKPNTENPDNDRLIRILRKRMDTSPDLAHPDFYPTPADFLSTWMRGYVDFPDTSGKYPDTSHLNPEEKGFELFYVNWDSRHPHFRIDAHDGISSAGRVEYRMLVSDINGMCDQRGYMNLGVNDLKKERVLVFRGLDAEDRPIPYAELAGIDKLLRDNLHFYVWDGKQRFPFDSPNLLKSGGARGTWTMVGFEPEAVYDALKNLEFHFP